MCAIDRMRPGCAQALAGAAAMLALALGCGCSTGDAADTSLQDRREIREALDELQRAFAVRDLEGVCDVLTDAARRHVGSLGHDPVDPCVKNLKWLAGSVTRGRSAGVGAARRITAIEVEGDEATAVLRLSPGIPGRVPLAREDGAWKVNALFGDIPAQRQRDGY